MIIINIYELYRSLFKRPVDIVVSGGVLLFLSVPLIAMIFLLHFANKDAGVFFFQERPGRDGEIFKVVKFKSMTNECDASGVLLPNEQRITKIGNIIRRHLLMNCCGYGAC